MNKRDFEDQKEAYMKILTDKLVLLRTKAEISQEALAEVLGVSRQTYGEIERKKRPMSWTLYLALIFYFDYNRKTHPVIRAIGVFPESFVCSINIEAEHK